MSDTVAVMTACWQVRPWVRRSVLSVLRQSYTDLRLYVMNDADPDPPWPELDDIDDPRLIRFDMPANRGRYFMDAVVLAADTDAKYWALMDPDDWCEPDRLADLVPIAAEHGMAQAPHLLYQVDDSDRHPVKKLHFLNDDPKERFRYHAGYASSVTSTDRIRAAGGFHADMRVGYDTYLTTACKLAGPWGVSWKPYTHKYRRPNSLMTRKDTEPGTPIRTEARARMERMWRAAWARNRRGAPIREVVQRDIPPAVHAEVADIAEQLRRRIP